MAISVVHTTTANSTSVTIPSTTAGNCLVVCVMSDNTSGSASVSGVTLGGSADNFSQLVAVDEQVSGLPSHWFDTIVWADPNCAGGQTSIAISGSNLVVSSSAGGVVVYEISGLAGTGVLDKSSTGPGNSGTWSSGTTGTTTQASEIFVGAAVTKGSVAGPSSPWTNAAPTGGFAIAGFQIVSSTGTATYNGTSTSGGWAAVVVTLTAPVAVTSTGSLALAPLAVSGSAAVPVTSTGSLTLAPLRVSGTAAETVPQAVNQWAVTFAQPTGTGFTPPALQSQVVALNNTTSVGGGSGVPTAGNWLFTIVAWTQTPVSADVRTGVSDDIRSWWRPGPWSPGAWQFTASGVPATGSYFIATTGQAAAITVGDRFTDQYNPGTTFQVTAIGAPSGGFQQVSFTPPARNAVNSPDQVTQVGKTRTYVSYTPNLARVPTQVYVAPTGSVAGMAVLVVEVSGLGPWDTVTGTYGNYAAAATSLNLALSAPSVPAFTLAAAAGDNTSAGQALSPGGSWTALHTVSASDGSDHLCDSVLTSAILGITTGSLSVNATASSAENLSGVIISVAVNGGSPVPAGQNPDWPFMKFEMGAGAGFQTPAELITWQDMSNRSWSWDETTGIQYQLGELQATNLDVELDNFDGALSPLNTQSPFYASPQILNKNSSFEQGVTSWSGFDGGTIAQSGTFAYSGNFSLQLTPDGVTASPGCGSELVTVTAGGTYTVAAWVYCTPGWASGIVAAVNWYNSAQTFMSTTFGSIVVVPAAAWTQFALQGTTAPAGAAYAQIILQTGGTPSSATLFYLDRATIVAGSNAPYITPLVPGTPLRIRAAITTIGGTTVNRWYVISRNVLEWPEEIDSTLRRYVPVTGTDIWSVISASPPTPYRGEVAGDGPYAWWPCDDQPLTGGVKPSSLLNAAGGNSNVLNVVQSPNGTLTAFQGTTDLGTSNSVAQPSNAVYQVGQSTGWMFGDPQSSPSTSTLGTTTFTALSSGASGGLQTAQPGSAAWQMTGGGCGNPGRVGFNGGGYGWFLSCNDTNFPSLSTGITVESWHNYGYWYTNASIGSSPLQQPPVPLTLWEITTGSAPVAVLYLDTSGFLQLTVYNGGTGTTTAVYTGSDLRVQSWFHVAVTMSTSACIAYLNGGVTATVTATAPSSTSFAWFIGNADMGTTSGGGSTANVEHIGNSQIAHVAIYPRILPSWRIWAHYVAANTAFGQVPPPTSFAFTQSAGKPWPDGTYYSGTSHYPLPSAVAGVGEAILGAWNSGPTGEATTVYTTGTAQDNLWVSWTSTCPQTTTYISQASGAELALTTVTVQNAVGYINQYGAGGSPPAASATGDTVQQRIERVLGWGGVNAPWRCVDPSALLCQGALGVAGVQAGSSVQDVAASDGGMLYVDNLGNLTYWQRTHLAAQFTSPVWNLGPTTGAGRIPYGRDIRWLVDPHRVWNAISIVPYSPTGVPLPLVTPSNSGLVRASQMQYGPQPNQITSVLQSQTEMQNQANWLLTYFGVAQRRAEQVHIEASTYPAAWPMVMGCSVGDIVTIEDWQVGGGGNVYTYRVTEIRRRFAYGAHDSKPEASVMLTADWEAPQYWA